MKLQNYEEFSLNEAKDSFDEPINVIASKDQKFLYDLQNGGWIKIDSDLMKEIYNDSDIVSTEFTDLEEFVEDYFGLPDEDVENNKEKHPELIEQYEEFKSKDPEIVNLDMEIEIKWKFK